MNHTFVICAYKESEFLEECIKSLKNQTIRSNIMIVSSTPNRHIEALASKYGINYYINTGEGGITQDWNFALSNIQTKYATIAHQDDVYEPEYSKKILETFEKSKHPIIAFTDYYEVRNGEKVLNTSMLRIKRLMLLPMRISFFKGSKFVRRRVLSLGDPICCPAVSFCLENIEQPIFRNGYRSCEDWEAWEKLSRCKGDFLYICEPLMGHRIHGESATTAIIQDNARVQENYEMYCKFWPKWFAKIINKFYTKSEKSNEI